MTLASEYRCDQCGTEDGAMFLQAGFKVVCPNCISLWASRYGELVHGLSGTITHVDRQQREFGLEHLAGVPHAVIHVPPNFECAIFDIMAVGDRWATWSRSAVVEHSEFPTRYRSELRLVRCKRGDSQLGDDITEVKMRMGRPVYQHDPNGPDGLSHFPSVATVEQVARLRAGPTRGERGSVLCKLSAGDWTLNWSDVDCANCHERFDAAVDAAIGNST